MSAASQKRIPAWKKWLLALVAMAALSGAGYWMIASKTVVRPAPDLQTKLEPLLKEQGVGSPFSAYVELGGGKKNLLIQFQPAEALKNRHGMKEILLMPLFIAGYNGRILDPSLDGVEIYSINQNEESVVLRGECADVEGFVRGKLPLEELTRRVEFETIPWKPDSGSAKQMALQYLERGRIFANAKGNYDKALSLFEQAEALAPGDYDVQFALAMTHWALGRNDEAIRRLEKTRDAYPQEYRTYPAMARCLLSANRRQEAAAALAKFDSLRPAGPGPYPQAALFQAAQAYIDLANIRRAVELLKDYIGLYPDHAEGHYLLGKIYFASGDKKQALGAFRRAASLGPDDPRTCQDLGWHLATLKDLLPAATAYRRSYTLGNRDVNVFVGLSYCYDRLGKYFDAKHVVIEGMKRFPNNTDLEKNFRSIHRTIVKRGLRPSAAPTPIELTEG